MSLQLMAIIADGPRGRVYLAPNDEHERLAASAMPSQDIPDSDLPERALGFRVQGYGMTKHRELFLDRQLVTLCTLSDLIEEVQKRILTDGGSPSYAAAVTTYLAFAIDKGANYWSLCCGWHPGREAMMSTFGRQSLQMLWSPVEANPFSSASGSFDTGIDQAARVLETTVVAEGGGEARQLDAASSALSAGCVCTDPPYYDNIGYADLSDFFYVWIRRSLKASYPELFSTLLVPKIQELIADPYRFGGDRRAANAHFEEGLRKAFSHMNNQQMPDFPMSIFYAFKQSEGEGTLQVSTGWETMLEGLIGSGLAVNGTWPIRTEQAGGLRELGRGALASSIVLVCRPRNKNAVPTTRKDFLQGLKAELPDALRRLQQGNIAPVDLAQAAIGPGMAVFSRYSKVVEADGQSMTIRTALGLINQVLDETLSEQEADFDADTRWALAWFEQYGMDPGPFGQAETLSRAKNTALNGLVAAGILESRGGKVRLFGRAELPEAWNPATDTRLTVWEATQHLICALDAGEVKAADLLRRVGGMGNLARELTYRLYVVCERKRWAKEALAYNRLAVSWPEIARLAASNATREPVQQEFI